MEVANSASSDSPRRRSGETEYETPDDNRLLSSPPSGSIGGAPSEDWSVISDMEEPSRLSLSSTSNSRTSEGRDRERRLSSRKSGITATMLSALTTTGGQLLTHRRSRSDGSTSAGISEPGPSAGRS